MNIVTHILKSVNFFLHIFDKISLRMHPAIILKNRLKAAGFVLAQLLICPILTFYIIYSMTSIFDLCTFPKSLN